MIADTGHIPYFTQQERTQVLRDVRVIRNLCADVCLESDYFNVRTLITNAVNARYCRRDKYGINPTVRNLATARLIAEMIEPDRNMIIATLLYSLCGSDNFIDIASTFGEDVNSLVNGMHKVSQLYKKQAAVKNENFRNLLLTFAEDIRVILIMIVDRLCLMRMINRHPDTAFVRDKASEALYLYAPLAHRLGLYAIKSELEDLSLKYTNRNIYTQIARKLNETKSKRDEYIANFIEPVKRKLNEHGLRYEIKGRTKSIYSIWNKIKKQNVDIDHIYDLFAIRVIIDTPPQREKIDCWLAYSVIVDMYRSNPSRMKDWLTIPKSNGYESLHTTVYGPDDRWVEVQIRSKRMDDIAERGLAAHWKYKGGKAEQNLDMWMNNVRDMLEAAEAGTSELMKGIKMDVYNKEVFAFSPKGDLYRLPLGATILDFAFQIHSKLGCTCVGGLVDGKNQKLNYKIKSGDTIEILTSANQSPKQDWLNFVVTSKARNKIRQTISEIKNKAADLGKELVMRRFKNRKIEIDDKFLMLLIKKSGFKSVIDFYAEVAAEHLDVNVLIERYLELVAERSHPLEARSANEFSILDTTPTSGVTDVLVIGEDIKGINYKLARCCNPIYGDKIVGFVSSEGVIKIHCADCANAHHLYAKYPYRQIDTRWSGKCGSQYAVTLNVVGRDDIGIVTNITSVISKTANTALRNISIDSHDGLFSGMLVIGVSDIGILNDLIKKIKAIKGVKDVQRNN